MLEHHEHDHAVHEFDGIIENRVSPPPVYFTILFYGLIVWGVAFCAFYLLSGWSSEAEFQEKMTAYEKSFQQAKASDPRAIESQSKPLTQETTTNIPVESSIDGAALYAQKCAMCHGGNAQGGSTGPDLTVADYVYGKNPEKVTESIAAGRSGGMPAFGNQLTKAEIQALVNHLLAL